MSIPVSVIILAFNEEKNIEGCLKSMGKVFDEVFVVDSGSTDRTISIAEQFTDKIYSHPFNGYSCQRNWAQSDLPVRNEWVFHIDADERITAGLAEELKAVFAGPLDNIDGFMISRKTVFMGRWIRHGGHYPVYHTRIFKKQNGVCEDRMYHQHFIVKGRVLKLKSDIIDVLVPDISTMIDRLNRWTDMEAQEALSKRRPGRLNGDFFKGPISRRRWFRENLYGSMPLFLRAFLYFFYRYIIRLGFLDGIEGLVFHSIQCLWQYFVIDVKIWQAQRKQGR